MLINLPEWQALKMHYQKIKNQHMRHWFQEDPSRFSRFSIRLGDLLFDYSKNRMTDETINLLTNLAATCALPTKISDVFSASHVNTTENRPAMHSALRHQTDTPITIAGQDVMPEIREVQANMQRFVTAIHDGTLQGHTGKPFRDVVNIGIGGSHLGPLLATHALAPHAISSLRFHFISDIDCDALQEVWHRIDPERTLFIISSKSFSTLETLENAHTCYSWLLAQLKSPHLSEQPSQKILNAHFIAITAKPEKARQFGISDERIFPLWDWVGGRYSVWSAIGLPLALQIGMDGFQRFLEGAYAADQHFRTTELHQNIPVLMGLLGVWYVNFFDATTHAIIPYDHRLKHLRPYLQQLDMESNGKSITHAGTEVNYTTGPIVWGELGIHGQHAFHQLLHQGTHLIPVDFLVIGQKEQNASAAQQDLLVGNALSQARALMNGQAVVDAGNAAESAANFLAKHQAIPGNRPSTMIFLDKLTPKNLGTLLALYEHKVFVQSVIWNINPFDQWGVELGKTLLSSVLSDMQQDKITCSYDSSTEGLMRHYKSLKDSNE